MKKSTPSDAPPKSEGPSADEVDQHLRTWFPDLSAVTIEKLVRYYTELVKFNKSLNLISSSTLRSADNVHIADSIGASRLVAPALITKQPLYDFGSGNGLPGLIFASLFPEQSVILVDRDQRKMEFCKHTSSAIGLKNVTVLVKGVEELPAGSVKNVIARGFAPFARSLLITRKQFSKGGKFFHMKTDGWANEIAGMPSQVFTHWAPSLLGSYKLPESTTEMFVVLTEKTAD